MVIVKVTIALMIQSRSSIGVVRACLSYSLTCAASIQKSLETRKAVLQGLPHHTCLSTAACFCAVGPPENPCLKCSAHNRTQMRHACPNTNSAHHFKPLHRNLAQNLLCRKNRRPTSEAVLEVLCNQPALKRRMPLQTLLTTSSHCIITQLRTCCVETKQNTHLRSRA
jgi:hypothetical protein